MTIPRTICLGFLVAILTGTLLLLLPISTSSGEWTSLITALFTATSAVCVTGLVVVDTGDYFSFVGQLIILLLIQVGGLGYMTISTFLMMLIGRQFDLRQKLAFQESFDRPFLQGSSNLVRSVVATTLVFEITGVFLLLQVFVPDYGWDRGLWLAIFHSVSSWNNAGFSLFSDSLVAYHSSWLLHLVIPGLIIFGGIGYQVIIELYLWLHDHLAKRRERFVFSLNFKVVTSTTLLLLLLGTVAFYVTEFRNTNLWTMAGSRDHLLAAWFQSVTTRTAGFNTIDIGAMSTAGLFITMGWMFIGASPSGTGGGIKTTTLRILTNCTRSVLRGKEAVIMYQREVPVSLVLKAVGVVFGSAVTIVMATMIISLVDPKLNLIVILFETISAFATVGLSTGITAGLSAIAKLILVATMFTGRVGVLLMMEAIIGEPRTSVIQYPEENLLVG